MCSSVIIAPVTHFCLATFMLLFQDCCKKSDIVNDSVNTDVIFQYLLHQ